MKLAEIEIKNFRKLHDVKVALGDATFLIGANNAGKTSTLEAIELLLSGSKLTDNHRSKYINETGVEESVKEDVIICGLFTEVSENLLSERGFNSERLQKHTDANGNVTYSFRYRIRLGTDGKNYIEMEMHTPKLQSEYENCSTWQDFIDKGADSSWFQGKTLSKKLTQNDFSTLSENYPMLYQMSQETSWFANPGGIAGNVLSKLPKFLKIEANVLADEMEASKSGTLHKLLSLIFDSVRQKSENYQNALKALELLSKEMDPNDEEGAFGKLMSNLNKVVDEVFPKASINIDTNLSSADSLKPIFGVTMSSNVSTEVAKQGTGLIRSAVFALLRFYHKNYVIEGAEGVGGLIIGFEEPELFLHPNAVENMRKVIYELASSDSQIVATTHSPYMIDLSQKPRQVLNSYISIEREFTNITAFNISDAFNEILQDDKARVKMVQKIDDYVSRVFFAQKVIVVEGDTEDIVFKKTISLMPENVRKKIESDYQIIKATGKATMISFIKYLKALNVDLFVVHDEDSTTPGAERFNAPILESLNNEPSRRLMMHNCIEDELGYNASSSDKPYKAYKHVERWHSWDDVPAGWKEKMKLIFADYAEYL